MKHFIHRLDKVRRRHRLTPKARLQRRLHSVYYLDFITFFTNKKIRRTFWFLESNLTFNTYDIEEESNEAFESQWQ